MLLCACCHMLVLCCYVLVASFAGIVPADTEIIVEIAASDTGFVRLTCQVLVVLLMCYWDGQVLLCAGSVASLVLDHSRCWRCAVLVVCNAQLFKPFVLHKPFGLCFWKMVYC
ncbi:hypothetical protein U1Q18_030488 [Sarracenia purpurea var. burkii]